MDFCELISNKQLSRRGSFNYVRSSDSVRQFVSGRIVSYIFLCANKELLVFEEAF